MQGATYVQHATYDAAYVQKPQSFVRTAFVHAVCFLVYCMASSPKNGHILRSTFESSIQNVTEGG
jgi:hypothetical protein